MNGVVSERAWTITFRGSDGQAELPKAFTFAAVKLPTKDPDGVLYQRYQYADLVSVPAEVQLDKQYGQTSRTWLWLLVGGSVAGLVLLVGLGLILRVALRKPANTGPTLPDHLTAFSVLEILHRAKRSGRLTPDQQADLDRTIGQVEEHFFSADRPDRPPPDRSAIARKWLAA